jgi:tyrosinase
MANGIVIRPSAENANVPALETAYNAMQALSDSDNRGWVYWAEFHGFNRFECWHHARQGNDDFPYDLFLPWHRAYLTFFDNAARDQDENAILPWWDWTSTESHASGIPAGYRSSAAPALQTGPMPPIGSQPARRTQRNPGPPAGLPTAQQVDDVLDLPDYRDFSNQLQDIHDGIHGWVGGDMGSIGVSAFDPVFWAHHCMIDRIWYLWQQKHGVNNIPPEYLDKALFPGYTVRQVLDVRALGYDYAAGVVAGGTDVPAGAGGNAPSPSTTRKVVEKAEDPGEPKPTTTGPKYKSRQLYIGGLDQHISRADIEFHRVDHAGASYEGRVYINNPKADADTGYEDASYAGSYHIFGHGGCLGDEGHCDVTDRRKYDPRPAHQLTPAKKVVIATEAVKRAIEAGDKATITVVPIIEPLPYETEPKHTKNPVKIGYVRIMTYR